MTDSPDHELVSCDAAVSTAATDVQAALRIREQDGVDRLIPALYDELRRMARLHLRRTRRADAADPTLATTALVNEAYLRLVGHSTSHWNDRAHFLALAAVAMRHILVDGARARGRLKRGAGHTADTLQSGAAA